MSTNTHHDSSAASMPPASPEDAGSVTTAEPVIATRPCVECGAPVEYEPVFILGRELGKSLARFCPACEAIDREKQQKQDMEERERTILDQIRAVIPPDLRDTKVSHPDFNRDLWKLVDAWGPTSESRWLGIIGPAGRCKTRILALKANRFIRNRQRVAWTSATKLQTASEDRSSRRHDLATRAEAHLEECRNAPILIIDDLGKNTWGPAFERHFFDLLDHRKNYRLPILWSSNVHPDELSQVISQVNANPIIGRLVDRCDMFAL